ncbi:hypothetical protein [uncultured Sulfitobacter sp.]|uniref:hypothetical protein n=1 Tax=uncultured Sulfitobacter sp. TaxID=191468 RepID=UPI0030DA93EF|tara:strand:- start:176400 stop:176648 length:249 start_codon:yes stop_codon:yes gene_type:complete
MGRFTCEEMLRQQTLRLQKAALSRIPDIDADGPVFFMSQRLLGSGRQKLHSKCHFKRSPAITRGFFAAIRLLNAATALQKYP